MKEPPRKRRKVGTTREDELGDDIMQIDDMEVPPEPNQMNDVEMGRGGNCQFDLLRR